MPNPDSEVQFSEPDDPSPRDDPSPPDHSAGADEPSDPDQSFVPVDSGAAALSSNQSGPQESSAFAARREISRQSRNPKLNAADASQSSSSASPALYESPSPPSSDSASDFVYNSSARPRRQNKSTVVHLPSNTERPISPIQRDRALWQQSQYVPVLADETTRLVSPKGGDADVAASGLDDNDDAAVTNSLLSRSRFDLERARFASRESLRIRENTLRDRYILGCSILLVTSIVFVIIVSGMTTMLANSNFPQLQIYSDWQNGGIIPLKYGCDAPNGQPISFPLKWRNVPRASTNLVVLFANAGAMLDKGYDPVHWLITDIPLNSGTEYELLPNASANPHLMPPGSRQIANAYSSTGIYWPPCTERNSTSLFVIHAYAIEASATIDNFRDAREVMNRFVGVPIAKLTGVYGSKATTSNALATNPYFPGSLESNS